MKKNWRRSAALRCKKEIKNKKIKAKNIFLENKLTICITQCFSNPMSSSLGLELLKMGNEAILKKKKKNADR